VPWPILDLGEKTHDDDDDVDVRRTRDGNG
jgi:hypothetical protein